LEITDKADRKPLLTALVENDLVKFKKIAPSATAAVVDACIVMAANVGNVECTLLLVPFAEEAALNKAFVAAALRGRVPLFRSLLPLVLDATSRKRAVLGAATRGHAPVVACAVSYLDVRERRHLQTLAAVR
jgi:hypothetical protein